MRILNATTGDVLAQCAETASTPLRRLRGLMFRAGMLAGSALVIEPCNGIHTCFMRFPIDVVFVARDMRAILSARSVAPWRFIPWVKGARLVVEFPAGTLSRAPVRPGDVMVLENPPVG
ncbi:MAG: DUF192 domain-containing protein [Firmicutes bacterium]|nr:DUF192 domain-containing protein [Bacillota bacterium]